MEGKINTWLQKAQEYFESAGSGSQGFDEEAQHTIDVAAITSSRKVWQ